MWAFILGGQNKRPCSSYFYIDLHTFFVDLQQTKLPSASWKDKSPANNPLDDPT
jgi:hypothetical protein